jgi:hypothetical protein
MAQNEKLLATLSKGGGRGGGGGGRGGSGGGGGGDNGGCHQTPWKEKKICPNCNKMFSLEANKDKRPAGWGVKPGK